MEKEGKRLLNLLSEEVKKKIIKQYGSIDDYYSILYKAGSEYYSASISKDAKLIQKFDKLRFDYAEELESFGVFDGLDIVDPIWGDFDEDLVNSKYFSKP